MRRFPRLAKGLVLVCVSPWIVACSAPRPPAQSAAATPAPFAVPIARPGDPVDPLPLSIERLVSEERSEIGDVVALAGPVGDARGRARAQAEVTVLANELREIEATLRASPDSEHLDAVVVKLHRLATRIALLHEALVVATGPTTAIELEGGTSQ